MGKSISKIRQEERRGPNRGGKERKGEEKMRVHL
jgi:hypothetical protein